MIAVLLFLAFRAPSPGLGGRTVDVALKVLGIALAFVGEALRFYTLGWAPEGTSGQGYELEAAQLNTRGPYAYVRNPLYLGNLGICAGLLMIANDAWIYAAGLSFFFLEYFFIIRAEEQFLRGKYGREYEQYASRVRRWVPRRPQLPAGTLRSRFDWRRALKKEHNPFAVWSSAAILLIGWQCQRRERLSLAAVALLACLELAVAAVFVAVKGYKRGWLRTD
jgi:protein-S-isoprenylcysteine O-methyltransferase Ste14